MVRLLVEVFSAALMLSLTILQLILTWLPQLIRAAWAAVRTFFEISAELYRAIARWLWPVTRVIGLDLSQQPWRSLFAASMSIGIGAATCAIAGWAITPRVLIGCGIHGLIVAFAWDQLRPPLGQSLGR